uniref:Ovule protein n=1 Tax=Ascaris lumbricoides TaxID=6252 RepID=A0A0M3IG46_ASCLU
MRPFACVSSFRPLNFAYPSPNVVTYTTKGSCKFKYGVEQIVKISEHAILPSMLRRY